MEITKNIVNQVSVQYTVLDGEWTYMDTLVFDEKEFEKADIEKLINEKYTIWKAYVTAPAKVPTKSDFEAKLVQLQKEKESLEREIAEVSLKIV